GKLAIDQLKPGNYQLVETKAPTGYELETTPIKFEIKKGQIEAVQVSMTNELTKGGVILTKTDNVSGEALQGAVFELQDAEGKVIESGLTTDASGKLAIDQLKPDNYQLVETKAPTGYELETTPIKFEVKKGQTEAVQVSMTNELSKGGFVLTKTDNQSGEVLQGAVFELQDAEGKVIESGLTTDASGKIAVSDLTPGNYQLVETKAPTGYELESTPIKFEVEKGQTEAVQVSMTNELTKGGVILTKMDNVSDDALQGAVFELQDAEGKVIESGLTTDVSGKLAIDQLKPGNYQLAETKAPTGYELDSTPIKFEVEKGQTEAVQVSMTNELTKGGVILTKTDNQSDEALQGALFELQDAEGKVIESGLTTDVSGKLAIDQLKPGNYQLVETKAPTGYELETTPIKFEVEKGQTKAMQLAMTNELSKGGFVLTKTDDQSGEVLQGAVFELQDTNGKKVQRNLTTDSAGKIAVAKLKPGKYQLIETKAPKGYELDATPVTFEVMGNQKEIIKVAKTNKAITNKKEVVPLVPK
ncbi:SpaA isopeptide-forming pilin-related protein, partial [Brochothrix thermosphacta]|uniref:SpaA isopeptide-forming pilin-related protein n=1 Tax=Brochothrix thermosphacta TaxID=2756 RepID=UPI000AE7FFBF